MRWLFALFYGVITLLGCADLDEVGRTMSPETDGTCPGLSPAIRPHLRVMPVGDSITAGNLAGSSYREPLLRQLNQRPDLQTVEFVGSQTGPLPCCHQGHPAARTAQVAAVLVDKLKTFKPDVLLVHLGTNDEVPEAAVAAHLSGVVDAALTTLPGVTVFSAAIIGGPPADAINALLVPALRAHPAYGSQVFAVEEMAGALSAGADYQQDNGVNDGIHPGPTGSARMAEVWRSAGAGKIWLDISVVPQ